MRMIRWVLTVLLAIALGGVHAGAWLVDGHSAVATIAKARLTPAAKAAADALLGSDTMESVSLWADSVASTTHQHSGRWHYVNTPFDATGYDASRDCVLKERGDCAIAAIPRLEQTLADRTASTESRREALMFLIHFIGDLHNPLHAIQRNDHDQDRGPGGIGIQVEIAGRASSLHGAWDARIIENSGKRARDLVLAAEQWLTGRDERQVALDPPVVWAAESFQIGKTLVYPQAEDGRLTLVERTAALAVIEERLALAGVRLAASLNRVLGSPVGAK